MAYERATFLGSSVRNISSRLGWNGQSSSLTVGLVDDPVNGDSFTPVTPGQPIYFNIGNFNFFGIARKYVASRNDRGLPIYSVECSDPRHILDKVKLILDGYTGVTNGMANLLNIYGYLENISYGYSQVNETGMPWNLVKQGIIGLTSLTSYGDYGGPISYEGYTYTIDLSELPNLPVYFRVPGPSLSLLEYIQYCCEYGSRDFFVDMVGTQIRVRTVLRTNQPPLGTITSIVNQNTETVVQNQNGLEERDEVTASFLVGGPVHVLYKSTSIETFWGYDNDLHPILGVTRYWHFYDRENRYCGSDTVTVANLNAAPIADITGTTYYACSTLEMRAALVDQKAWLNFLTKFRSNIAQLIDAPDYRAPSQLRGGMETPNDNINANSSEVINITRIASGADANSYTKAKRLYDFVHFYAQNYMGKKYLCRLPFVLYKRDSETLKLSYSYQPTDAGYVQFSGENDLDGLPTAFSDLFQVDDTRYVPFCYFSNISNADLGSINPTTTLVNGTKLYARGQLDDKLVFIPEPAVIITVDPVYQQRQSILDNYSNPLTERATSVQETQSTGVPSGTVEVGSLRVPENIPFVIRGNGLYEALDGVTGTLVSEGDNVWSASATTNPGAVNGNQPISLAAGFIDTVATGLQLSITCNNISLNQTLEPLDNPLLISEQGMCVIYRIDDNVSTLTVQLGNASAASLFNARATAASNTNVPPNLHPAPIAITHAHIPLRSNILTYGPWYAGTKIGKVHFEQDESLTPWNYGGYSGLNLAANAKVASLISDMTVAESGFIEMAGLPTHSLGDILQTGGPNITSINIEFSEQGVKTSYYFETYVPRFGQIGKYVSDRIRRISSINNNIYRNMKQRFRLNLLNTNTAINVLRGNVSTYLTGLANFLRRQSPHNVFITKNIRDTNGAIRPLVSVATLEEALAGCNADDTIDFNKGTIVDFSALVRPITFYGSGQYISAYNEPTGVWGQTFLASAKTLNPLKINGSGHDYEILLHGSEYDGVHHYRDNKGASESKTGFLALRAPLILSGFGYSISGNFTENVDNYLVRSDLWKTGPIDPIWDDLRKVWTVHGKFKGKITTSVTAANSTTLGSGNCQLWLENTNTFVTVPVFNWMSTAVSINKKVFLEYFPHDNKLYITGVDC